MAPMNNGFHRNFVNLVIIIADIVPKTTETVADRQATFMLVQVALKIIGLDRSVPYHLNENRVHVAKSLDSLNE